MRAPLHFAVRAKEFLDVGRHRQAVEGESVGLLDGKVLVHVFDHWRLLRDDAVGLLVRRLAIMSSSATRRKQK